MIQEQVSNGGGKELNRRDFLDNIFMGIIGGVVGGLVVLKHEEQKDIDAKTQNVELEMPKAILDLRHIDHASLGRILEYLYGIDIPADAPMKEAFSRQPEEKQTKFFYKLSADFYGKMREIINHNTNTNNINAIEINEVNKALDLINLYLATFSSVFNGQEATKSYLNDFLYLRQKIGALRDSITKNT